MCSTISCNARLLSNAFHQIVCQIALFGLTLSNNQKRALTESGVVPTSCLIESANFRPCVRIRVKLSNRRLLTSARSTVSTEKIQHLFVHDCCVCIYIIGKRVCRPALPRPVGDAQHFGLGMEWIVATDGKAIFFWRIFRLIKLI